MSILGYTSISASENRQCDLAFILSEQLGFQHIINPESTTATQTIYHPWRYNCEVDV